MSPFVREITPTLEMLEQDIRRTTDVIRRAIIGHTAEPQPVGFGNAFDFSKSLNDLSGKYCLMSGRRGLTLPF